MNKIFEEQNEMLLNKLREIHAQMGEMTKSIGKLDEKSSSKIKKRIVEIKLKLKDLKAQKIKYDVKLKMSNDFTRGNLKQKVKDLNIDSILKKEATALDKAITKVTRAEKICNSTLIKAKVELLSAELACLEVIKSKTELDEVIHQ